MNKRKDKCQVCKDIFYLRDLTPLEIIRYTISSLIQRDHPDIDMHGFICTADLTHYLIESSKAIIESDMGKLNPIEEEVLSSIKSKRILADNINEQYDEALTFGQRFADIISNFGGSWYFICIFMVFLLVWMFINSVYLVASAYDPYPFILLNLILSCLAALQAPIIMMSQNRRALKDKIRADNDYQVNLLAELQIRDMNAKIDHNAHQQLNRFNQMQQSQIEMLEQLAQLQRKNNIQ